MSHIILTGATGTAGAAILAHCLESSSISRISILSRRPVKQAEGNPKANVIIHEDYLHYPEEVLTQLRGATGCVWAQGGTSMNKSEAEYTVLTHDYPIAAAKAFSALSDPFIFVYMSGEGADINEKSRQLFGRIKGRAERHLFDLASVEKAGDQDDKSSYSPERLRMFSVRPGGIDPKNSVTADRKYSLAERMLYATAFPLVKTFYPSMHIGSEHLAKACVDLAVGNGEPVKEGKGVTEGGRLLDNTALKRMANAK